MPDNQAPQQTWGQAAQNILPQLLQMAFQMSPGAVLNNAATGAMNTPMNQSAGMGALNNVMQQAMSPIAVKAAQKELNNRYTQHAQQTDTASLEQAVNQAGMQQQPGGDGGQPQQPPQQPGGMQQPQGGQGGFNPLHLLGQLLGSTQGGYNPQTGANQVPGLFGGALTSTPEMLNAMTQAKVTSPGYIENEPMTPTKKKEFAAGAYTAQTQAQKDVIEYYDKAMTAGTNLVQALAPLRNPLQKGFGLTGGKIDEALKNIDSHRKDLTDAIAKLGQLSTAHPNNAKQQSGSGKPMGNSFSQDDIAAELRRRGVAV